MRNCTMMLTSVNVVSTEDQHERRQDRHAGDEQRQQGEERREHEEQHEQGARARRAASRPARWSPPGRRPRRAGRTTSGRCRSPRPSPPGRALGRAGSRCTDRTSRGTGAWIRAYVVRPSSVTKPGSPVLARSTTRSCTSGTAATAAAKTPATAALVRLDRLALRHGDDCDVGVERADPVRVDQLLLRVVTRLAGQREVQRPPVAERRRRRAGRRGTAPARAR